MRLKEILQARRFKSAPQTDTENQVDEVATEDPCSSLKLPQFVISAPLNDFYSLFEGCTEY